MRLRPALMTCVVAALAVAGIRLASIGYEINISRQLDHQRAAIEVVARDAAGLLVLTQDYGLYHSDRAAKQWAITHQRLFDAMADYATVDAAAAEQVDGLQNVARDLPKLFEALRQADAADSSPDAVARRETLIDQLVNDTRRISDGAFELSHALTAVRRAAAVVQRWTAVTAQGLMLGLTLLLAWLLMRRVLAPIDQLRVTADRVKGGDFSVRGDVLAQDELGDLARALRGMTEALAERDAALRRSNERLARGEAFQTRVGQIAGVGGWEVDLITQRLSWTAHTFTIHELTSNVEPTLEEALGFYPENARRVVEQAIAQAIEHVGSWDMELPFRTQSGRDRWVRVVGNALRMSDQDSGPAIRLVGALQDITERRAADDALRHALQAADAASAAKSAFLANMSHEIRTPMNAMMGIGYLLEGTALDATQRDLLAKSSAASRNLLELINSVLDLSKIEAGEMLLESLPMDLPALLLDVTGLMRVQAEAKGLTLALDIAPGVPAAVSGDAVRLRQILSNLLSNAIKFTQAGQVRLGLSCTSPRPRPVEITFVIEDSGIGIPAEALARLFTPFTQADESTSRRFGGTGLGLSIVKHLCDLMGGHVDVSSIPGRGSRFTVSLPFEPAENLALANRPLSLLLVSDDMPRADLLAQQCRDLGWQVELLGSVPEVLRRLGEGDDGRPDPDVVLFQEQLMPAPGAPERERLVALLGRLSCVLTRAGPEADRWLMEGLDTLRVLGLPADASRLFDAVHAALSDQASAAQQLLLSRAQGASAVSLLPGVRVLVVDDSDINREVAERILTREGAIVSLAQDGEKAVALLRASPDAFDAVLMDVQMPVLDGLAATRLIRTRLGQTDLPVLALTAGALQSERQRALEAGMNGFVSKPFDPAALVVLLRQHVERAQGRRLPFAVRPTDASPGPARWLPLAGIDMAEAQRRLEGDRDLFARLLRRLLEEFADLATTPAGEPDPTQTTTARLHKLVGSAGLLAAGPLRAAAQAAEAAWRQASGADRLAAVMEKLCAEFNALKAASDTWLAAQDATAARAATPAEDLPLDAAALKALQQALMAQDLAAVGRFKQLSGGLATQLGELRMHELDQAMQRLDFAAAALLLDRSSLA